MACKVLWDFWIRAWAGRVAKQKARSPNARGFPSCRQSALWGITGPSPWEQAGKPLRPGGGAGWERGPARDAPKLLLTRQNPPLPRPLPRQIGSAVPLKGPESELRMKLTHGGRGGPWAGGVPGQQQQRKPDGDRSCLCALLRRAETTKRHLNSTVQRDSCNEVTPHNGGIQDPRGPAGLGACPPPGPADGDVIFR